MIDRVHCDFAERSTLLDPRDPGFAALRRIVAAALALRDQDVAEIEGALGVHPLPARRRLRAIHGAGQEWHAFASAELRALDAALAACGEASALRDLVEEGPEPAPLAKDDPT